MTFIDCVKNDFEENYFESHNSVIIYVASLIIQNRKNKKLVPRIGLENYSKLTDTLDFSDLLIV